MAPVHKRFSTKLVLSWLCQKVTISWFVMRGITVSGGYRLATHVCVWSYVCPSFSQYIFSPPHSRYLVCFMRSAFVYHPFLRAASSHKTRHCDHLGGHWRAWYVMYLAFEYFSACIILPFFCLFMSSGFVNGSGDTAQFRFGKGSRLFLSHFLPDPSSHTPWVFICTADRTV